MTREEFEEVFDFCAMPIISEIDDNNPKVKMNDIELSKQKLFIEYNRLNRQYKSQIFQNFETELLDRHKIAACMCGAFLKVSIFNKQEIIELLKNGEKVEPWFYYVNEFIALITSFRVQAMFMIRDFESDLERQIEIGQEYPIYPIIQNSKRSTLYSILYNLSQIKDERQIGLEHYDLYAYSMFFFVMEKYYLQEKKLGLTIETEPSK